MLKPEQKKQWAKEASPADAVFARYVKHHGEQVADGMEIDRAKFDEAVLACEVHPAYGKSPAQYAIENISVSDTLVAKEN